MSADDVKLQTARLKRTAKKLPLLLSGVSGEGVTEVLRELFEFIEQARDGAQPEVQPAAWRP